MAKGKRISDPNAKEFIQAKLDRGEAFTEQDRKELKKVARLDFIALLEDHGYQLGAAAKNSVENIIHFLINGKGTPRRKKTDTPNLNVALRDNTQHNTNVEYPHAEGNGLKRETTSREAGPSKRRKSSIRPRSKSLPVGFHAPTYLVNYITPGPGSAHSFAGLQTFSQLPSGSGALITQAQTSMDNNNMAGEFHGTQTMVPVYNTTAFLMPYPVVSQYSADGQAYAQVLPEVTTIPAGKLAGFSTLISTVEDHE